jgi:opacity protein-like surface antigen
VHKYSTDSGDGDSESQFGYQFGAGLDIPVSSGAGLWVEGRYMGSSDTTFFGILAGFGFDVSGGG